MNINIEKAKNGYIVLLGHTDRYLYLEKSKMISAILDFIDELDKEPVE